MKNLVNILKRRELVNASEFLLLHFGNHSTSLPLEFLPPTIIHPHPLNIPCQISPISVLFISSLKLGG